MIRLSEILREGYKEIDELERLSEACIRLIIKENSQRIQPVFKWRFDNPNKSFDEFTEIIRKNFFFSNQTIGIKEAGKGGSGYSLLKDFIKDSGVRVEFSNKAGTPGVYGGGTLKRIYIKMDTKPFAKDFAYQVDIAMHLLKKIPSQSEIIKAFSIVMGANMRSTLIHELQHAYDDWRSGGKYDKNKQTSDYKKKYTKDTLSGGEVTFDTDHWAKYAQLPHEYWARFSQTVRDIFMFPAAYEKPFSDIQKKFVGKFPGYKIMQEPDKKRLFKALYKYWDENRKNQ